MNTLPLASLELLNGSRVAVAPVEPDAAYQYVYRAELGVEWNEKLQKFLSPGFRALVMPVVWPHRERSCLRKHL